MPPMSHETDTASGGGESAEPAESFELITATMPRLEDKLCRRDSTSSSLRKAPVLKSVKK